ncbi:unnamed protein product [Anisakis simplex]|uniref:G_PROTEIN_RECEP_F1_2 domain-containing protein n=1 Tax=Anisakis simplex TaxID=6269 RepID=A0A0M3JXG2_ANISI|nr:unnamed protein product [Anisakis simplex]
MVMNATTTEDEIIIYPMSNTSNMSDVVPRTVTMSAEHLEHERYLRVIIYYLDGYSTLVGVLIGVLFNAFSMLIFRRMNRGKFSLAHYYLLISLICQIALLLNCFLIYCVPTLIYGDTKIRGFYSYVILIAHALSGPSYIATTWIVFALTVERYFALRKPFEYRLRAKASRVKRVILGILIAAFIFCIPRLFEYKTTSECISDHVDLTIIKQNVTTNCYVTLTSTELLENKTYWAVYHVCLVLCFVTLLPSATVFILTLRISCFLHRAIKERQVLSGYPGQPQRGPSLKGERESNIMLIMVIIKFSLSDPLPMAETVIGSVAPEDSPAQAALLVSAANFLVILCSSINFFMFFASGQHFRRECRRIICRSQQVANESNRYSIADTWYCPVVRKKAQLTLETCQ